MPFRPVRSRSLQAMAPVALVFGLALLAGCVTGAGFLSTRTAPVLGGAFQVGVPSGYCIDRSASRESGDKAVVIMGRCADNLKAAPALLTVSIGDPGSAGVMAAGGKALAEFFTSNAGRATLSREGRAGEVRVVEALSKGDAFLLHLIDRREGEYWRAILGQAGRLVTVSVTGTPDLPLDPAAGRKVLDQTLAALASANRG